MTLRDKWRGAVASAGYLILRWMILNLSDQSMGKFLRVVERLAYAISGDPAMKAAVAEVADIFETGPPFTTTVRKLFKDKDTATAASAVRCLLRKSPYGAM